MKWSKEKINDKKEYFFSQRKNPTGMFTEMVVRTYFLIYKQCSLNDNFCPSNKINSRILVSDVYENFYDNKTSNHVPSVVDDCINNLNKMGYIKFIKTNSSPKWMVKIEKNLDFILDGEEDFYFKKYNITQKIV